MKYLIITEIDWLSLRDEVLSLAACCLKAFGEPSKHTDWLHNGDVCRLLGISKRTLQHYRDTGVLVLPGRFFARETANGNPGKGLGGVGLVDRLGKLVEAAQRMVDWYRA